MFYGGGFQDDFDDETDAEDDEPRSPVYSDHISSDCEAEMYQKIHHAEKVESQIVRDWKNDSSPETDCRYFERLCPDEKMSASSTEAAERTLFTDRCRTEHFEPFKINSAATSKDTSHSSTSCSSASAVSENSDSLCSLYRDESTTNPWKFSFLLERSTYPHNGRTLHMQKQMQKGYSTSTPINKQLPQRQEPSFFTGCTISLDDTVESTDDDGVVLIDSTDNTVNSIKSDVIPSFREPSTGRSELYRSGSNRNFERHKPLGKSRSCTKPVNCTDDSSDSDVIVLDSASSPDNLVTNVNIKGNHGRPCSLLGVTDHRNNSDYMSLVSECHSKDTSTTDGFSAITVGSEDSSSSSGHSDGDSWHIDPEDKVAPLSKKARKRYYQEMADGCRKCGGTGHPWKRCTQSCTVKCYLCGGSHKSTKCTRKVCGMCYSVGHDRYQCTYPKRQMKCNLCRVTGHMTCRCPDIWRRYHLTTTSELITKASPHTVNDSGPKFCYNCGNSGHFGHECIKPRLCKGSSASLPYIVSYKNPAKMICRNPPPPVLHPDYNATRLHMKQSRYFSKKFFAREKFNHFKQKKKLKKLKQDSMFASEVNFNRTPKANAASSDSEIVDIWKRKRKNKKKKKANAISNFVSEQL